MQKIMLRTSMIVLLMGVASLSGCKSHEKKQPVMQQQIIVAKLQTPVRRLYFSGTLLPIQVINVEAPVGGLISEMNFTYGERIKKGQKLLVMDSKPLADSYHKAVNDYLQKKQAYVTGKTDFEAETALYKAGVVAKNDYITAEATYDNHVIDFKTAQYALEKVLRTAHLDSQKIESLSLSDVNRVNEILQTHFKNVEVNAPEAGVALFPTQSSGMGGGNGVHKLEVGSSVKDGQLLLSIGDLSGLSATFDVSEVDIDRIKKGMPVIVTGSAFPGAQLNGVITAVSVQANQNEGSSSGLSMFTVNIKIPKIEEKVMEKIRVGMTAKFEIDIKSAPRIMLPVDAVTQVNGRSVVRIQSPTGIVNTVPVLTGDTTPTEVVIINGVKEGDKIVIGGQPASTKR